MRSGRAGALLLALLAGCGPRDGTDVPEGDPVPPGDAWQPEPGVSWQWQLSGDVDTGLDVEMYDIDLSDPPDGVFEALSERVVICYFSAGSYEDWRDDADRFPESAIGRPLEGWDGEWWLDVRDAEVRRIMAERLERAVERGCDGVEPDNVDGYANRSGFDLTYADQVDYNRFIADEAHRRGLSVGLKNDLDQLEHLVDWYDWALNEECVAYQECDRLEVFTGQDKAAFHVEYVDDWSDAPALAEEVCGVGPDLDTLVKTWDLTEERLACP